jgi:hypothetical protein
MPECKLIILKGEMVLSNTSSALSISPSILDSSVFFSRNYDDTFLLFADCDMLAGEELGKARRQIRLVADRIKQNLGERPFGLIWSKSDIDLDEETAQQITGYITNSEIANYSEFKTSVHEGEGGIFYDNISHSISWVLETLSKQINELPIVDQHRADDMFLSKR